MCPLQLCPLQPADKMPHWLKSWQKKVLIIKKVGMRRLPSWRMGSGLTRPLYLPA